MDADALEFARASFLQEPPIAQRSLLTNDIKVDDHKELLSIVVDELFPSDSERAPVVRELAAQVWPELNETSS